MGCYMSTPDNRVFVTEGKGKNFIYATASCQGWRREQEDAEDCLPHFEDDASLFILCDGHGGAEVAKYTVEHLPNFIKNHELYKDGNYAEALEQAFIDFDALLRTDQVLEELHRLAFDDDDQKEPNKESLIRDLKEDQPESDEAGPGSSKTVTEAGPSGSAGTSSSSSYNGSSTVVDDVSADILREEAKRPLKELMAEYVSRKSGDKSIFQHLLTKYNSSPVVKSNRQGVDKDDSNGELPAQSSSTDTPESSDQQPGPSSSKSGDEPLQRGPSTSSVGTNPLSDTAINKAISDRYFKDTTDSSDDSEFEGKDMEEDEDEDEDSDDSDTDDEGDSDEDEDDDEDDDENDDDGDDEGENDEGCESSSKRIRRKKHKRNKVGDEAASSSDDGDESDDELGEEEEDDEEKSSEDKDEDADDEEGDAEEDDDEDDDEENESQWEDLGIKASRAHKPGMDSGCTVVVALVKGDKIYVASSGDSRCILIMRNGECKPMSFDHKPEDGVERRRIMKAGGRVTEGRVNGGLNLSRALGDFTYKSPNLDARDQMITPCPDVRIADLDPSEVEYVFLACDGIWNSMKNQQATKFIRNVAPKVGNDLVEICLKLFRSCIAPRTDGDGTGCDNMTCILARYDSPGSESLTNSDLKEAKEEVTSEESGADTERNKRSNEDETLDQSQKRRCVRKLPDN